LCRGLHILKFDTNSSDLVFYISIWEGLEFCLEALNPPKPRHGYRTVNGANQFFYNGCAITNVCNGE